MSVVLNPMSFVFRPIPCIFLLLAASIPAVAQTATWWYPLGTMGATRQAGDTSRAQTKEDLKIRWRTTALRNSPTVLVGGLRSGEGDRSQQVVGLMGDTLVVLSSLGKVELSRQYQPELFELTPDVKLTLTGLFNTAASSPRPQGRPNAIGLGVELNQRVSQTLTVPLHGVLLDREGEPFKYLHIPKRPDSTVDQNESAAIYPVAAYSSKGKPSAFAVVSQNDFRVWGLDTMANGLRRYDLGTVTDAALQQWRYRVASKAYAQAPAIAHFPDPIFSFDSTLIALSTEAYLSEPSLTIDPFSPDSTNSGQQYSITLIVDSATTPIRLDKRQLPQATETQRKGEVHSYFVRLDTITPVSAPDGNYRLLTENHDPQRPGLARIAIVPAKVSTVGFLGQFSDAAGQDRGWTIVTADIDRRAPNGTVYKNNSGIEIVAAFRSLDGSDVQDNKLFVLTYRLNRFGDSIPRFGFAGRLMGAGDIVTDTNGREEIIIANNNQLTVLQLKDYRDNTFDRGHVKRPFDTLKSFHLDSHILDAAIADLDGDGNNEIIVSTMNATYAIGSPVAQPFGTISPMMTEACAPEKVGVTWMRSVGGEGSVTIKLLRNDSEESVVSDSYPAGVDSIVVETSELTQGSYRLIIQDNDLPHLVDTSATFTVNTPSIDAFEIPPASYQVGDPVRFTTTLQCIDSMVVEESFDGTFWQRAQATITAEGIQRSIEYMLPCPPSWSCDQAGRVTLRLRSVNDLPNVEPRFDTIDYAIPASPLLLDTGRSRNRLLSWASSDFNCDSVTISFSVDNGNTWREISTMEAVDGEENITVPIEAIGRVMLRLCCGPSGGTACDYGITELTVGELPGVNFVAPNPFNPNGPGSDYGSGAAIVYRLQKPGTVRIVIFDASRTVAAVVNEGAERNAEQTYMELWDGRNGRGEIVANGTYICVIESSSSERIYLPIIVIQR